MGDNTAPISARLRSKAHSLPLVSLQVYDRIIPHRARETLALLMLALVIALVLDLALRTLRSALLGWRAMYFARQLEHEGVSAFMYTGGFHIPPRTITSSVTDDLMVVDEKKPVEEDESAIIKRAEAMLDQTKSTDPFPYTCLIDETRQRNDLAARPERVSQAVTVRMGTG